MDNLKENLKNLTTLLKKHDGKQLITNEEFTLGLSDIVNSFAQYRSATGTINQDTKNTLNTVLKQLNDEHKRITDDVNKTVDKLISTTDFKNLEEQGRQILSLKDKLQSIIPKNGRDGRDGRDGKNGKNGRDGIGRNGKDGSPDTPDEIRDKLETLEEDDRLDAKAIKNLPEATKTIVERMGGGSSQRVVAGTNINITLDGNGSQVINSTGSMSIHYAETPNEAIDGNRVNFTVDNTITFIISIFLNGQFIHPADYTYTGTTITWGTAPDISYAGLPFTIIYY